MGHTVTDPTSAPTDDRSDRRGPSNRTGAVLFVAVAAVLWIVMWLSTTGGGLIEGAAVERFFDGPAWLRGWVHWDGEWYQHIAREGYFFSTDVQSSVAFFPAYPVLLGALESLGGSPATWGIVVTLVCGLAIAVLFPAWCRRVGLGRSAATAVAVLLLWPYAWYLYGAVYSDAMFLAFVLGAFVMVERDEPVAAGLLAAVATATRPVGAAVMVALAVRVFERRRRAGERLRPRDFGVLLSAGGLLAYMAYLAYRFDNPLAFADAQDAPGWENSPGPRTWFKHVVFERLADLPHSGTQYFASIVVQAVLAIGLIALVPLIYRRLGYAYALYTLMVLGMPLVESKDFYGLGRYCLAAFPAFAVLGEILSRRPQLRIGWLVVSAGGLVFLAGAFARGRYLA